LGRLAGRAIDIAIANHNTDMLPDDKTPLLYNKNAEDQIRTKYVITDLLSSVTSHPDPNDPIAHLRSQVTTSGDSVAKALVSSKAF
jgi:hypothetical protein